jgi:hypothetical protein
MPGTVLPRDMDRRQSWFFVRRLTIRPPTDYPLLEKWNEQIKRDTVLITVEANLKRIRSVMQRNNLKLTPYVTISGPEPGDLPAQVICR